MSSGYMPHPFTVTAETDTGTWRHTIHCDSLGQANKEYMVQSRFMSQFAKAGRLRIRDMQGDVIRQSHYDGAGAERGYTSREVVKWGLVMLLLGFGVGVLLNWGMLSAAGVV